MKKMYSVAIVDDENHILDMLETFLERKFSVRVFLNPEELLQTIKNGTHYDIVLSDIMMPQMNGLELLEHIQSYDSSINVIMMTAFDTMDKALEAHKLGAKYYIKKPFESLKIVEETINKVLAP